MLDKVSKTTWVAWVTCNSDFYIDLQRFKMDPNINFETLSQNPFSAEATLNDNSHSQTSTSINFFSFFVSIYCRPEEIDRSFRDFSSDNFSTFLLKIRSFNKTFESFRKSYNFSFWFSPSCFLETWENSDIYKNYDIQLDGYSVTDQVRKHWKGNEVTIFLKQNHDFFVNCNDIETFSEEILNKCKKSTILNVVCRPREGDLTNWKIIYQIFCQKISAKTYF